MSDNVKGRRAAERRRQQQSGEEPSEATTPGQMSPPDPSDFDDGRTAAGDGKSSGGRKTSITSMTSVGSAAQDALKQAPLERTKVRPVNVSPDPLGGRLICLEGRDIGKSWDLTDEEMVIGRGKEVNVKLTDPTVSRVHFEIHYDVSRNAFYFLPKVTDPPPMLNGEEAAGSRRELADGDVIEIGETQIRFVRVDGPAPKPKELPPPKEPTAQKPVPRGPSLGERLAGAMARIRANAKLMKRLIAVGVVAAVALSVGGYFGVRAYSKMARERALTDPQGAYQQLLTQAKALRESRRWEDLAATGEALHKLAPERPEGQALVVEAREEQQSEKNLNLGRMNYTNAQYDAARSVLKLIPDRSVYRPDRDKLLTQVNEVGRGGSIAAIQNLMAQGRYEDALARLDQHLLTYPDDEEARSLRAVSVKKQSAREAMGSATWQALRARAIAALDAGDMPGAIAIAEQALGGVDAAHAGPFVSKLKKLQSEWRNGKNLLEDKKSSAVGPLQRAKDLEDAVAGGRTALARDISRALGDAYYLAGIDALASGRECEARPLFEKALGERGSDPKTQDKLSRLSAKAREFLGKAEAARARGDKGTSMKLAREAVCRFSRSDDGRARAERLAAGRG